MTGNETIYLNDGHGLQIFLTKRLWFCYIFSRERQTQQVEVNLYVRRPYIVWEESNLYKVQRFYGLSKQFSELY